jgi:hypothetical protein
MSDINLKSEYELIDVELEAVSGGFIGETVSNNDRSTGSGGCTRGSTTETTSKHGYCSVYDQ